MPGLTQTAERLAWRPLARLDALANRLYSWRYNPLYQSGALVVVLLAVVIVTGIYLTIFYRIGSPYESVARITAQAWTGRWIRSLHRFASDAAMVAAALHAFRFFAQGRTWGPRALAWISGTSLLLLILICGWTGYVMVWDVQGQVLAVEGAKLMDALPIFSEPIGRTFVSEAELPSAFFFLNLFLHLALPVLLGLVFWIHVSRVARPTLLPPRKLMWGVIGLLSLASVALPVAMAPEADLFTTPVRAPYDLFYSFWVPVSVKTSPLITWSAFVGLGTLLLFVPALSRPREPTRYTPSWVDEEACTGCEQCYLDCPYEAIAMFEAEDKAAKLVARVDPALCVSCGICAGSCAPMRVGPPDRTGHDQLERVRTFIERAGTPMDVVVIRCDHSGAAKLSEEELDGALPYSTRCAGNVHTSVVEYLVRSGARGVLIAACPPRDCWSREGPLWLEQRLYHEREAELQERVDRDRVRLAYASGAEPGRFLHELREFRVHLTEIEAHERETEIDVVRMCEVERQEVGS